MKGVENLLADIRNLPGTQLRVSYKDGTALIALPDERTQAVCIAREDDRYVFSSRIMGATRASQYNQTELAQIIWFRNRETDVVELALDNAGRLIGRIEVVAEALDRNELEYYLTALAQECDRLEYILTGHDQM